MATQQQGWITIQSCINDYLIRSEQPQSKYFKLFHTAYSLMEDLGLDFFYSIKSVKIAVSPNKTVVLPNDYLHYTKIGVLGFNGQVIPLKYNDRLTSLNELSSNRVSDINSNALLSQYSFSSPTFFNYWNGNGFSNLQGSPNSGSFVGTFKIDEPNGVILLQPNFIYPELILEYTATPKQDGQEYYIPMAFREAMITWLAWQDIAMVSPKRGMAGVITLRRNEFFEARRKSIAKYKPFDLDQAVLVHKEGVKLVNK